MVRSADVVIVGAGIPGLALAVALQERKISTTLLDGRRNVDTSPRGLTLQPNGMQALDQLGLMEKIGRTGSQASIFEVRGWNGELVLEADYTLLDHPFNYLLTVNMTELDLLLRYRAEKAGAQIVGGVRFQDLFRENGRVEGAVFEFDGEKELAKALVVVGADGTQSRVRASIGAHVKTHKYKDSFVAGLVGRVRDLEGRARQYQGPGKMLGVMPMGAATSIHHCVGKLSFDELKQRGQDRFREELTKAAPELVDAFQTVSGWTGFACFQPMWIIVDKWVDNGVALLGDSAHAFHPHAGQGLNLSLQDALTLSEVIENCHKTGDFSARALRDYESKRMVYADVIGHHAHYSATYALSGNFLIKRLNRRTLRKMQKDPKLLKQALQLTAGLFEKKPSLWTLAKMGGIIP